MQQKIETLQKTADFLKITEYNEQLEDMQTMLEKKEYLVSFMGQFSAGKSSLINNIIGKNVLPVHITETTAVITLIRYSEVERAEVIYQDGRKLQITIEESLDLWQAGNTERLQNISVIVTYTPCDLLKNGLIIADTPGINTVIEEHIQLTAEILTKSEKVVYVMGKAVTEADLQFLKKIEDCQIEIIFARTHMDTINLTEETEDQAIEKDCKLLKNHTIDPLFFLSNEKESKYYDKIVEFIKYLKVNLAENVEKSLQYACGKKAVVIAKKLLSELESQENALQQLVDGNVQEYNENKKQIERVMKSLDEKMKTRQERAKKRCDDTIKQANEKLKRIVVQSKTDILKTLQQNSGADEDRCQQIMQDLIMKKYMTMQQNYIQNLENIVGDGREELKEVLETVESQALQKEFMEFVPEDIDITNEQLRKLQRVMQEKEELDQESQSAEQKKDQLQVDKAQLEEKLSELDNEREELARTLREYPEYQVAYRVIQEATNNNQILGKRIGSALDWATILLPGKAYTTIAGKGAEVVGKVLQIFKQAEKAEKVIEWGTKVKNAVETAEKIDKTLDVVKGAKKMSDQVQDEEGNSPLKVFDYLTFEHHLEKFGKRFDQEEITEVDKAAEEKYYLQKEAIEKEHERKIKKLTDEYRKLDKKMDQIRQAEIEENIRNSRKKELDQELQELQIQFEKEKSKNKFNRMCTFYAEQGEQTLQELFYELKEKAEQYLPKYVELYVASDNVVVMQKLALQKNKLEQMEARFSGQEFEQTKLLLEQYHTHHRILQDIIKEDLVI